MEDGGWRMVSVAQGTRQHPKVPYLTLSFVALALFAPQLHVR